MVSFWRIGEKPHKINIKKKFEGCSVEVPYTLKLRTWLDGKILVLENKRNPDIDGFVLDSLGSGWPLLLYLGLFPSLWKALRTIMSLWSMGRMVMKKVS